MAWKLAAGVAVGWAVGRALGWLLFHLPNRAKLSRTGDGFVVLGVTFLPRLRLAADMRAS